MEHNNIIDFASAKQHKRDRLWRQFTEEVECLKELWPWDHIKSTDVLALMPEKRDHMIYFSCENLGNKTVSITIYPNSGSYCTMLENREGQTPDLRSFIETDTYGFLLGPKEEVPEKRLELMDQRGVDCGEDLWPWLIRKRRGYTSGRPNEAEFEYMVNCLDHLIEELTTLEETDQPVAFEEGTMVLRYFDERYGDWLTASVPFALPEESEHVVFSGDQPLVDNLKDSPKAKNATAVEFDFGWRIQPKRREGESETYFENMVVFADRSGKEPPVIFQCRPEELLDCSIQAFQMLVRNYGRPETVYVCREESDEMLGDLAEKLGIKIHQVKELPAAKRVLGECDTV